MRAQAQILPDGRRLHLHDGPIDIILEAFGQSKEVDAAYHAAACRFATVLDELCCELAALRRRAGAENDLLHGAVARRMLSAVIPYAAEHFITPMAAVAGSVAEDILSAMTLAAELGRAYVNDGGDIAFHLTPGESFAIGMVEYGTAQVPSSLFGKLVLDFDQPVRGIATSGWRGRSFSFGIADAVTVLAETAAAADAAATIVANAVDLPGHPAIVRMPARDLDPQSDLQDLPVTRDVGHLAPSEIEIALQRGLLVAESLQNRGLIHSAALHLCGETHVLAPRISLQQQLHKHKRIAYA